MTNQKAFTPALPHRRYGPSATQRWHLLGLKGSQRCLRASHRRRKPPLEASWRLLHFASSSLAHIRDGPKGRRQELPLCCLSLPLRRWRHRRCAMEAAKSHSWSCFTSQPKLVLSSHFHFWFTYPFVAQVSIQIKVQCFIFLSSQSLGIKLFIRQLVSLLTNTHVALARLQAGAPSPLNASQQRVGKLWELLWQLHLVLPPETSSLSPCPHPAQPTPPGTSQQEKKRSFSLVLSSGLKCSACVEWHSTSDRAVCVLQSVIT